MKSYLTVLTLSLIAVAFTNNCKKTIESSNEDMALLLLLANEKEVFKCSHGEGRFSYEAIQISNTSQTLKPFSFVASTGSNVIAGAVYAPGMKAGEKIEFSQVPTGAVRMYTKTGDCQFLHPNRFGEVGYWPVPTAITDPRPDNVSGTSEVRSFEITQDGDFSILVFDDFGTNTSTPGRLQAITVRKVLP